MAVVPNVRTNFHGFAYDTKKIAVATATPTPISFFVEALGQGTSPTTGLAGKQIQDTNLTQPQKLPNTAPDMWLHTVRFLTAASCTFNDLDQLMQKYILTLYVNEGIYLQAPIEMFPAGGGIFSAGLMTTAQLAYTTTNSGMINGFPSCGSVLNLVKPVGIGQGETVRVELQGTTFTTDAAGGTTLGKGLFMRVVLEGELGAAVDQR